jgi:RCC1 and BTB domain-containing protein
LSSITLWPILHQLKPEFVSNIKLFCVFSEKGNNVIIVTKNDKVFTFGSNEFGCLGLGHNNAVKESQIVNELCDQQIIDISYGDYHVLALTKSGKCFSWGLNSYGQLGNGTRTDYNKPKLINALLNEIVVKIVCAYYQSFVLTKSGDLYGFGYNDYGQIGCGNNTNQSKPIKINRFNNEKIVSIACGAAHSLVLTDVGHVYSWGFNVGGQLGIGNTIHQNTPQKLNLNTNEVIESITCGRGHSLLLTTDGNIYAFGWNSSGQIGNGTKIDSLSPLRIIVENKFKEIVCNHLLNISVAKAENDLCYVWGECENELISIPQKTEIKSIYEIFSKYPKIKITPKPIYLSSKLSDECSARNRALQNLLKLFNNPKYSDLIFKIEDKHIYVQKCILENNCKYFKSKFKESTRAIRESTENKTRNSVIEITEYSYDVYYAFLKYLYTDSIKIKVEKAMDLLVLANDYKEEELKLKCVDIIKNNITLENICSLYCSSVKYNLSELEEFCFNFAATKMSQIVISEGFHEMDKNSVKKFMERAAKSNVFK